MEDADTFPLGATATNVNVYATPLVSPIMVHVVVDVVQVAPPGEAVTVYVMPRVVVTAGHDKVMDLLAVVVETVEGEAGGPSGMPVVVTAAAVPSEFDPTTDTEYC
jgi:hypothetical protein